MRLCLNKMMVKKGIKKEKRNEEMVKHGCAFWCFNHIVQYTSIG